MNLAHLIDLPKLPENLRLIRPIGSGAAGSCFLVTDITDQALALKIVSEKWEERELESIRALRKIPSHPALAQILGSGKLSDGRFYYTMELADNAGTETDYQADTLGCRMKNRVIPLPELLRIITTAASGAEHLHGHGLFHGDVKPENIIFVNGAPKLADFGTLSSDRSGTAGFYPENPVSGADRDCYALGMTLYCAWSGLDASLFPQLPESFDPEEWRRIRKIYLQACSPVVRRRFASASALISALNEAAQPRRPLAGKYRLMMTAGAALLFLILIFCLVFLFFRREETPPAAPLDSSGGDELAERRVREFPENRRRSAAEWLRTHPKEIQELADYGVTVTQTPEGRLAVRDPEFKENGGVYLTSESWYNSIHGRDYLEVKRWLREHPEEAARIEADGIHFFPDPEYGLQYRDSRNGLRGVGNLADLRNYWKEGPLFHLKKDRQP